MKIALIQPNSPFLINQRVFPNIGLVRVATKLLNEEHQVSLYDMNGKEPGDITRKIWSIAHDYDVYGFSSTTPQFPYTVKILEELKKANPKARTILGGAHASALYSQVQRGVEDQNTYDLRSFDTVFAGEGEDTTNMFKAGWQRSEVIKDIDQVPIPDRMFIDNHSYKYLLNGKETVPIQTQRGCPGQCTFCCGRDIDMYKKVRKHSPARVLEELDQLHKQYGYDSFMWYDDEVNVDVGRLEELCGALATRQYQHRGFVRSDQIVKHPQSIEWLRKAGFVKLCTGVESGSDRMLKNMRKGVTVNMNTEARKIIGKAGVHYEAFMLLGHPDETIEDAMETFKWLYENKPDDFDINLITPYPGSKMYDEAVPSSSFEGYEWEFNRTFFNKPRYSQVDSFYRGKNAESKSDIRTRTLTYKDLKTLQDKFYKELKR